MFRIASVSAPNRNPEHDEFSTSRLDFAEPSVPTILCGDFNAIFDGAKDRRGSDPAVTVRESFVSLELLFREFCVLDVWRHLFSKLLVTSGLDGGCVSPLFHLFRIGGTEARNISKVLRFAIVVVLIMNVLCRSLSFLPLHVI